MKKLFLIAMVLTGLNAKAQYFQHLYGTTQGHEHLRSGVNTVLQGQGHFIAGQNRLVCIQPLSTIPAAFTDVDGNIPGAPYFARNYILSRPNGPALHAMGAQAFELDNGAGFGLIGMYIDFSVSPNANGIYFIELDGSGNPVNVYDYTISNTAYNVGQVGGIAEATYSGGNEVYITGGANNGSSTFPFALEIDINNGAVNWGWVYDIYTSSTNKYQVGLGVTESPYMPYGAAEIVVVGTAVDYSTATTNDAILMHIDASNGALLANVNFYGTSSSYEEFRSIRVSNNTTVGPAGFIIGGNTDAAGSSGDHWVVNTDDAGNVNFSNAFDYTPAAGTYNWCNDVIERLNLSSVYEYYAVGTTNSGVFGNNDIMVVKIDDNGNGISEFTYGGPNNDLGQMLDQDNASGAGNPPDGLSIYGWWGGAAASTNNVDMYIVKSYFDGQSGCNEQFNSPTQAGGPVYIFDIPASQVVSFTSSTLAVSYLTIQDNTLCYAPSIGGASNARVAPGGKDEDQVDVLLIPNPAESGITDVEVVVESDEPGQADITIYDMAGRQVYNGKFAMNKGANNLKLDISKSHLTPGMYTVQVNGAVSGQTILLQVN